jgi:hypothetical protein
MERVDILLPPTFKKSGEVKTLEQAWNDENWIGTFNLWIVQDSPVPAIVYQQRSPKSNWAPKKLDVTAGGHYEAGERISQGLREVREELGKNYKFKDLQYCGRKLHVGPDTKNRMRQNVVDIFIIRDNAPLSSYTLEEKEVYALCVCPISKLIKAHTDKKHSFVAKGIDYAGKPIDIKVTQNSFPYNWDNYHFKMALLADRFLKGDKNLIY